MGESRVKMLLSSVGLSLSTTAGKCLGIVRDMLIGALFGAGPAAGAWALANLAPNLFRRIFGEGAVGTALTPMLAASLQKDPSRVEAAKQLRAVMLAIALIMTLITLLGIALPLLYKALFVTADSSDKVRYVTQSIPVAMPYAIFICVIGVATAGLNIVKQFFWPGIAGLVFNIFTILTLWIYQLSGAQWETQYVLWLLCASVVFSGAVQLLWILCLLKRHHLLAPRTYRDLPWKATLRELWRLSFPAVIGAGAIQISLLIDWMLALYLPNSYAAGSLMFAEHVGFLPISVVALSLGSVGLAHMTNAWAAGNADELKSIFNFNLRYTLFLAFPMAVFTFAFAEPIVRIIFERGKFGAESVANTVWALKFLCIGIPAFCAAKIVVSAFHARKDMLTPVRVTIVTTILNVVSAVILMQYLEQGGLALAMVIGSTINNLILLRLLNKQIGAYGIRRIILCALKSVTASLLAVVPCVYILDKLPHIRLVPKVADCLLPLLICAVIFGVIFALLSLLFGAEELRPILRRFRRSKKA